MLSPGCQNSSIIDLALDFDYRVEALGLHESGEAKASLPGKHHFINLKIKSYKLQGHYFDTLGGDCTRYCSMT